MKIHFIPLILLFFVLSSLLIVLPVYADDNKTPEISETDYLGPQDLSPEDHAVLSEYTANYNQCLRTTVQQELNNHDDPRTLVDFAMKTCAFEMENLNMWMVSKNLAPGFRQGYIRSSSNRATNRLLQVVMMQMAMKNSEKETENQAVE